MALVPYFAEASFDPTTPGPAVALVHPGGSQTGSYYFRGFDVFGGTDARVRIRVRRYPTAATGGTTNSVYSFLDGAPASPAQVLSGAVSWPVSVPSLDTVARVSTRAIGEGAPRGNIADGAITIGPGHTLVLETLDADPNGSYDFRLYWGEVLIPLPHIVSQALAASSAFTAGTYFELPQTWSAITFWVSYTAHASTILGGKPKWRVSRSDGTNDFVLPIVEETLDILSAVATQEIYQHEQQWPALVSANTTIRFCVPVDLPPGTNRIRLDVAEIGDTTNRGTVSATITGR